jgi:hypothetical protein
MKAALTRKGYYKDIKFITGKEDEACDYLLCHMIQTIAGDIPDVNYVGLAKITLW